MRGGYPRLTTRALDPQVFDGAFGAYMGSMMTHFFALRNFKTCEMAQIYGRRTRPWRFTLFAVLGRGPSGSEHLLAHGFSLGRRAEF